MFTGFVSLRIYYSCIAGRSNDFRVVFKYASAVGPVIFPPLVLKENLLGKVAWFTALLVNYHFLSNAEISFSGGTLSVTL